MSSLITLEEPFRSKWRKGYLQTHPNGRKYICLFNSNSDRSLISYARYLLCVRTGSFLHGGIEADHRDNDGTNDRIENIQPLSSIDNIRKAHIAKRGKIMLDTEQKCIICHNTFRHFRIRKTCGEKQCVETFRKCNTQPRILTDDEKRAIGRALGEGKTYEEIRENLNVSMSTIAKYRDFV